jgi:hypothetical protein
MKIKPEHFEHLKTEIEAILSKYDRVVDEYEKGQFPRSEKVKDLQKRFCFDVLYGAGLSKWVCDNLYPYMNDDHLYTALKAICPKLERKF